MKNPINSLTIVGWILGVLAFAKNYFPELPIGDVVALIEYLQVNWEVFMGFVSLILVLWGRFRKGDLSFRISPNITNFFS